MWRRKMVLFTALVIIVLTSNATVYNEKCPNRILDSLENIYGNNKQFDSVMYEPALMALAYYPELKSTHIEYRYKKLPTLMAARPAIDFIFRKKHKRRYIIFISNNPDNHSCRVFNNMSQASKIGILGHEYAHLLEYEKKSNLQMAFYAILYFLQRRKIERETDCVAIERGLGKEMLEYTIHIKKSKFTSQKYRKRKNKYYLSVMEIRDLLHTRLPASHVKNY